MKIEEKLTIGMYQAIHSIPDDANEVTKGLKIISTIEGLPVEEIREWKIERFKNYLNYYSTINFKDYEKERLFHLNIDGTMYKINDDPSKMSSGQFIDIVELMKKTDDPIMYIHEIIAILTSKRGKYDASGVAERAAKIKDLPLKNVWGVFVFFLNLYWHYLKITETYLEKEMEQTINSATELLNKNGRGS